MELLSDLNRLGVPCALVTMSYKRFVAPILSALPEGAFRSVVTGDAVSQGKPHPEPYLKAARNLGVDPGECLAIEDSNTGARSAVAAGCTVLVVPNHVPVPPGERGVFRDSLGLARGVLSPQRAPRYELSPKSLRIRYQIQRFFRWSPRQPASKFPHRLAP